MRITGGEFKGRDVLSKKERDTHIRPTSGKVREALFNLLAHGKFLSEVDFLTDENPSLIHGRIVADLYAGTGVLGYEALSRGASKVIFADMNDKSLKIAQSNAEEFKVNDRCMFIRTPCDNLPSPPALADVVFIDPPYDKKLVNKSIKNIASTGWLKDGGILVVEHSKKEEVEEIEGYKFLDSRQYNNTTLTILKRVY